MADNINTNDANEELERFTEYLKRFGGATVDTFEELGKLNKNTKEYDKAQKALWKNLNASVVNFDKSVKKGTASMDDYLDQIEKLDDALEHATDAAQRETIQKNRDIIAEAARTKKLFDTTQEVLSKTTTATTSGTGQFTKSLQNGASATQSSADLFSSAIDIAAASATGLGSILIGFTERWIGEAGAKRLGKVVQGSIETMTALLKFSNAVLSKEVEKTITSYHDMAAAGAMFADGMTGMRAASAASGLTLQQFSNVVKNNTDQLASSGLGMTSAVKMMGSVGKTLKDSGLQTQLLKLGVGFEEQAELTAQVMADMKAGQVGPLRANSKEIAEETAKYAENLRIISAVTGQDAKKKMDQVRQQATQLAFQQKLAGMSEKQRTDVLQAMGGMNTLQRKNYMDMMVFGHVINKEGAAAAALSGNLRQSTEEAYNLTMQGNFDLDKQLEINKRRNTGMQQDALGLHAVGMAHAAGVGGLAQALGEAFGLMLQEIKGQTPEAIAEAQAMAKQQKTSNDQLTTGVVNAAIAAQNLANDLEAVLTPAVGHYAEATAKLLTVIEEAMKEAGLSPGARVSQQGVTGANGDTYDYKAMDYNKPSNAKYKANHDLLIKRQREAQDAYDRTAKGGDIPFLGSTDAWQKQIAERKRQLDAVNKNLRDYDESVRKVNPNNNPPAKTSDASARAPGNIKLATIRTKSGLTFQVAEDKAPQFLGFIRDLEYKRGYDIKKITGYDARPSGVMDYNPKTGKYDIPSGRASHHSTGTAIDINPSTNPNLKNKIVTDMPSNITADAAKWGIGWGANWATQKDSMHFDANPASGGRDMARDEVLQLLADQNKELAKVNVNLAEGNRISKQIKENGR